MTAQSYLVYCPVCFFTDTLDTLDDAQDVAEAHEHAHAHPCDTTPNLSDA